MKRVLSAAVFLVGVVGSVSLPSSAAADHLGGEDINVVAKVISEREVDTGPKGLSAGDYFIFSERLMKRGERVGSASGRCDVVRATRRVFSIHCTASLTFTGKGQLTVQGRITFRRGDNDDPVLAVTGGTGDYAGASGEFVLDDGRGPTRYQIHLAG